jgi:hypothetical protein
MATNQICYTCKVEKPHTDEFFYMTHGKLANQCRDCYRTTQKEYRHIREGAPRIKRHGFARGGQDRTEYKIWRDMRQRCQDPKSINYADYGGRGIKVCERWESFIAFLEDMGLRPSGDHTLDRKNNDGNYEPGNCRWATRKEQHMNRRNTVYLEFNNQRKPLKQWAEELGLDHYLIRNRLKKGWSVEKALTEPVDTRQSHPRSN